MDKVSVPISDNIKRNNMLAFANRPELMKQYTTSSKYAGVQRHNMMMVAQLFLLLHSHQDVNMAYYFRSENQTEPPNLAECKVPLRHVTVRWTVTLLSWQSSFFRLSGYQSCGWAFVAERGIVTFLFTYFTQILVGQSPSH